MLIDAHVHTIERITSFSAKGEGRPIGNGSVLFANGESLQMIPPGMGDFGFSFERVITLMDSQKVDKAVLLQSGYYGLQNLYAMEAARWHPERFHPVASLDPMAGQRTKILHNLIETLGFRSLKFEISEKCGVCGLHADFKIDGPEMNEIYEWTDTYGMSVSFDLGGPDQISYQISGLCSTIRQHPHTRFILCHLLCPNDAAAMDAWRRDLAACAADNVWFDFSSMHDFLNDTSPYATSKAFIRAATGMLGSERMIWGSDVPMSLNQENYQTLLRYFSSDGDYSQADLDNMLGQNAIVAYGIQ